MNAYVSFMNAITTNQELKHSTQACNMVSGVLDASFTE